MSQRLGTLPFEKDVKRIRAYMDRQPLPTGISDHGALTGLPDDDHVNYVHISTARTISADHIFTGEVQMANVGIGVAADSVIPIRVQDTAGRQLRLQYDGTNLADFQVDGSGNLTIANTTGLYLGPAGDIIFVPGGGDAYPSTNYTVNLGLITNKFLTLHAAELWVETLVAQDTMATIGGRVLIGPTTQLIADAAPSDTSIDVKHNQMSLNDTAFLEADGKFEAMIMTSGPTTISGGYRYSVTRNVDGSGANQWYAGDAVFNTGLSGDGFIDLYSLSGVISGTGPTIVGQVRNSTTWNDIDEHFAIGNLNGVYGYGSNTYGLGLGKYAASVNHVTIDPTNGIRFFDGTSTVIGQFSGTTLTVGNTSDNNVLINTSRIAIRNSTTRRVDMSSTRVAFGVDTSTAADSHINVFLTGQTYNGEIVAAGDMLIGDNSSSKANIFWDSSAGILYFRAGTTANIKINTDGSLRAGGDVVRLLDTGIEMHLTGDADQYFTLYNSDITVYTSAEAYVVFNKTDTQSNTYGAIGIGVTHDTNNTSMMIMEFNAIIGYIKSGGTSQYLFQLTPTSMFFESIPVQFNELSADPSAPSTNNVYLYAKDNGSGKTQLCARFPTGAVQVLATEP